MKQHVLIYYYLTDMNNEQIFLRKSGCGACKGGVGSPVRTEGFVVFTSICSFKKFTKGKYGKSWILNFSPDTRQFIEQITASLSEYC